MFNLDLLLNEIPLLRSFIWFKEYPRSKIIPFKFSIRREGDIPYSVADNRLAKSKLNWKPKTSFKDVIKLTFNWYCKNREYFKFLSRKDIINRLGRND